MKKYYLVSKHQMSALLLLLIMSIYSPLRATIVREIILEKESPEGARRITLEGDSHRPDLATNNRQVEIIEKLLTRVVEQDPQARLYLELPEERYLALYKSLDHVMDQYSKAVVKESKKLENEAESADLKREKALNDILSAARASLVIGSLEDHLLAKVGALPQNPKNIVPLDNRIVLGVITNVVLLADSVSRLKGYRAYTTTMKLIKNINLSAKDFFNFVNEFLTDTQKSVKKLKDVIKDKNLKKRLTDLAQIAERYQNHLPIIESDFDLQEPFFPQLYKKYMEVDEASKLPPILSYLLQMLLKLDQSFVDFFDLKVLENIALFPVKNSFVVTGHRHVENLASELELQGFKKIYDSYYTLKNKQKVRSLDEVIEMLETDTSLSDVGLLQKLQTEVEPLADKDFEYPLLSTGQLIKLKKETD
jgi:hypothetical protein